MKNYTQIFTSPRYKINLKNEIPAFKNVGHPVGLSVSHDSRVKSCNIVTVWFSGEGNTISASASSFTNTDAVLLAQENLEGH